MSCENCKGEKHEIAISAESGRFMADVMQEKNRLLRIACGLIVALATAFVIMAFCMVWAVQNAQNVANEAMINALNTVAEIGVTQEETTTTTTVNQDAGEGNGNNIYQPGEKATYNEAASSSAETGE